MMMLMLSQTLPVSLVQIHQLGACVMVLLGMPSDFHLICCCLYIAVRGSHGRVTMRSRVLTRVDSGCSSLKRKVESSTTGSGRSTPEDRVTAGFVAELDDQAA